MTNTNSTDHQVDLMMIYSQTKTRFLVEARRRLTIQERFEHNLPLFLIVILLVFFILSASHTASMVNRIVPAVNIGFGEWRIIGYLAPVGFELGLMVLAMMLTSAKLNGSRPPRSWIAAEALLFLLTLISNLAGSIIAALEYPDAGVEDQITRVLTLVVAVAFSVAIPLLSLVIGQGVARLVFERRTLGDAADMRWRAAAFEELRRAFFTAYRASLNPRDAARKAEADALNYAHVSAVRPSVEVSVPSAPPRLPDGRTDRQADSKPDMGRTAAAELRGEQRAAISSKKELALQYIRDNWDTVQALSVRQVVEVVRADGLNIGRDTVHQALGEVRAERGGEG